MQPEQQQEAGVSISSSRFWRITWVSQAVPWARLEPVTPEQQITLRSSLEGTPAMQVDVAVLAPPELGQCLAHVLAVPASVLVAMDEGHRVWQALQAMLDAVS